jgi:broad-specificity NMP kinase
MRNFPSSADLSREQQAIYSEHLDKALLIIGPPGTGKTVMAIMRAQRMREQNNETARILMHNNTLREFTHSQAKDIEVETMQRYLKKNITLPIEILIIQANTSFLGLIFILQQNII